MTIRLSFNTYAIPILGLFYILFGLGCSRNDNKIKNCPKIDINSEHFRETEGIFFDSIVNRVQYVLLETKPESQLGAISSVTVADSNIIIISQGRVLVFNNEGKFLKIGRASCRERVYCEV